MKKFKKIYCTICITILIASLCIIPVSAASFSSGSYVANEEIDFFDITGDSNTFYLDFTFNFDSIVFQCEYISVVRDDSWTVSFGVVDPSTMEIVETIVYSSIGGWETVDPIIINFSDSFVLTGAAEDFFIRNFTLIENKFNLFTTCYNLIVEYVFAGEGVENGILIDSAQHLTVTVLSTIAWIFVVVIPFIVVWWIIKVICTAFGRF